MAKEISVKMIAVAFCFLTVGCKTTSQVSIMDNVRKVITYETDKRLKVVSEKIEMEDGYNPGQWWEAKKISKNNYVFTATGIANKRMFEEAQIAGDAIGGGY